MDLSAFERRLRDPRMSRNDLETMQRNAAANGQLEHAELARRVLQERFPRSPNRSGGGTPTVARFLKDEQSFETGKAAYLWLVDRFLSYRPDVLDEYLKRKALSVTSPEGRRFGRNAKELFPAGSSRAGDTKYFSLIGSGWYVDTNLNHDDKFAALLQLASICQLSYPQDWDFRVSGGTTQLRAHQDTVRRAEELLAEFLKA
jgi:hypothetical protein